MPHKTALAAVVTIVLWASAFVVIRGASTDFSPGVLSFLRLAVGSAALLAIALVRGRGRLHPPRGHALVGVIGYGVAWFAGYTVVLNAAERHLDAGTAALLVNVAPILVAVSAAFLFRDGLSRPVVAGSLVAFAGIVVIALGGKSTYVDVVGIVLALVAAVLYAVGVLLQKVALRSVDALTATWVGALAGLVATSPFAPGAVEEIGRASTSALLGAVYLGLGPTAIAFTTWAYALSRTDAGKMAATTLAAPAVAILISWIALGETPTVWGLVGGALALTGVAVSRRRSRSVVSADSPVVEAVPPVAASGTVSCAAGASRPGE